MTRRRWSRISIREIHRRLTARGGTPVPVHISKSLEELLRGLEAKRRKESQR